MLLTASFNHSKLALLVCCSLPQNPSHHPYHPFPAEICYLLIVVLPPRDVVSSPLLLSQWGVDVYEQNTWIPVDYSVPHMRLTVVDILISGFWEVSNEIKALPHLPYCQRWPRKVILGRGPPYQPLSTCNWSPSIPSRRQATTRARTSAFSPVVRAYHTTVRDADTPTHVSNR